MLADDDFRVWTTWRTASMSFLSRASTSWAPRRDDRALERAQHPLEQLVLPAGSRSRRRCRAPRRAPEWGWGSRCDFFEGEGHGARRHRQRRHADAPCGPYVSFSARSAPDLNRAGEGRCLQSLPMSRVVAARPALVARCDRSGPGARRRRADGSGDMPADRPGPRRGRRCRRGRAPGGCCAARRSPDRPAAAHHAGGDRGLPSSARWSRTTCARRSASSRLHQASSRRTTAACSTRIGNDHLDRVLGAAARMNSMIDALLALSQLSSQPLARAPVNLSQLAGYVVEDLRRQSPEREVEVEIEPGLAARATRRCCAWCSRTCSATPGSTAATPRRADRASARQPREAATASPCATTAPASTCASPTACSASSSACTARAIPGHRHRPGVGAPHRPAPRRRDLGRSRSPIAARASTSRLPLDSLSARVALRTRPAQRALDRREQRARPARRCRSPSGMRARRRSRSSASSRAERMAVHQHARPPSPRPPAADRSRRRRAAAAQPGAAAARPASRWANAASTAGTICRISSGLTR